MIVNVQHVLEETHKTMKETHEVLKGIREDFKKHAEMQQRNLEAFDKMIKVLNDNAESIKIFRERRKTK